MNTRNPRPTPLLLSPREAAQVLAISPRKLWSITFAEQPGLPYVRVGRLVRYRPADLEAWVARQRRGGES